MGNSYYLSDDVKITKVAAYTGSGTTAVTSDEIDMAGFDGVVWVTAFGTANAGNLITHHDHATSGSEAATVAHVHSGDSDEVVWLDIKHPLRFCKCVATRGSASVMEAIFAIQYCGRSCPVDNTTTGTIAGLQFEAPAAAG